MQNYRREMLSFLPSGLGLTASWTISKQLCYNEQVWRKAWYRLEKTRTE
ncbi:MULTISPECIES: hypothetical protein [Paenibacillus]|nr:MULTISPECIES: hypothetical protein [Paenibacillus]WDQ32043.1 hypothetical protein PTQ21_27260 [Paenibacillus marchantiae]